MKVLIIEDDPAVRHILGYSLSKANYEVLEAEDGEEGRKLIPEANMILLDLNLPKVSGEQLLREMRNSGNYTPVIIISGVATRVEGLSKFQKYKIVDFIAKPYKGEDLLEKVEGAMKVAEDLKTVEEASDEIEEFVKRQTIE